MMGVDYELFWTLNPKSLAPFVRAFSLKQKYDDRLAWSSGVYIRMAIASNFGKQVKYPQHPFLETATVVEVDTEAQQQLIKDKFMIRMKELNSRFGEEES